MSGQQDTIDLVSDDEGDIDDRIDWNWDAKAAIEESLDLIDEENNVSFYAHGQIGEINPGLFIDDLGGTGLPISEHDAQRIISTSRRAPFGKGKETFVDTSVRKTWEIDAKKIQLKHPKWPTQIEQVVNDVAKSLGIARGSEVVRAELYKLLVYEPGAMFKAHTDTEKADGMFGTLAVCLPSKHTGGNVELSFRGSQTTLSTAVTSEWSVSYLAWYSDVLHEVKPVTSGYRIVLTFNLIQTGTTMLKGISTYNERTASLKAALDQWDIVCDPAFLIYLLEHKYTDASVSLDRLKGNDLTRVQSVAKMADETNCVCYLASVEKEVVSSVDEGRDYYGGSIGSEDIVEELNSTTMLKRVLNLKGEVVLKNVPVEEEDFVQDDPFDGEPDDDEFSGFTGNEGADVTHWY